LQFGRTRFPLQQALKGYDRAALRSDALAGLTTAVMLVPQSLGYATLAGLPPVVGLYASLVPLVMYALSGSSRTLSVGPVAMDSLLVAVTVSAIAQSGSDQYLALSALLALIVGVIQLTMGLFRMGFVANFLSRPVLSGFTSAAALIIGGSQIGQLIRVPLPQTHHVHRVVIEALSNVGTWHLPTLTIGLASIVLLVVMKQRRPKWPRALIVVAVSTTGVIAFSLAERGVATVGMIPSGLPPFLLPTIHTDAGIAMWPGALTIALLSFVEAISSGRNYMRVDGSQLQPDRELVALGLANSIGSLFGGFAVAGGLSRTAINVQAGARTQLAGVFTAAFVLFTLLFLTPLFASMPKAVLAAIIVTAVAGLFDLDEPKRLFRIKRSDLGLLVLTFASTLTLGIQWGILAGVGMSVLLFLIRTTRPHFAVLGRIPGSEAYLNVLRHPHAIRTPGVLVVRIDLQLYFGNVTFLKDTLRDLAAGANEAISSVVLDASGMNQLDGSGEAALREVDDDYRAAGIKLYFAHVKGPVRDVMYESGLLARLSDEQRIFLSTHDAVMAASGTAPPTPSAPPDHDSRDPADRIGCGLPVKD